MQPKTLARLQKSLSKEQTLKGGKFKLINSGHNRDVYLVKTAQESYVARIEKVNNDGGASVENEVRMLKFFESVGISFVPKIIFHDPIAKVSIETYVGGRFKKVNRMTSYQTRQMARQLAIIHSLPVKEFRSFCRHNNFTAPKLISRKRELDIFGTTRFKKVMRSCPDQEVIKWIRPRLKINLDLVKTKVSKAPQIVWGDIGNNICHSNDGRKLFFIDWEFTRLAPQISELAYFKIHSHPSKKMLKDIVKVYARYRHFSESLLWQEIEEEEKIIRVNDVIWAAMKWGEAKSVIVQEFYRDMAYKRMKLRNQLSKIKN